MSSFRDRIRSLNSKETPVKPPTLARDFGILNEPIKSNSAGLPSPDSSIIVLLVAEPILQSNGAEAGGVHLTSVSPVALLDGQYGSGGSPRNHGTTINPTSFGAVHQQLPLSGPTELPARSAALSSEGAVLQSSAERRNPQLDCPVHSLPADEDSKTDEGRRTQQPPHTSTQPTRAAPEACQIPEDSTGGGTAAGHKADLGKAAHLSPMRRTTVNVRQLTQSASAA